MQIAAMGSTRDAFLVAVPVVIALLAGLLRLDQRAATPGKTPRRLHGACGLDDQGNRIFLDPDGRPPSSR